MGHYYTNPNTRSAGGPCSPFSLCRKGFDTPMIRSYSSQSLSAPHRLHRSALTLGRVASSRGTSLKAASYAPATDIIDSESSADYEKLLATFKAADTNQDGVLQREELLTLLETVGDGKEPVPMHWVTDEDMEAIFRQYDTNRDGVISFSEFKQLAKDKVFLTRALAEYRAAFNAIDTGYSGTISPTELYRLFVKLDSPFKEYEKIVKLMERYDVDGNGQIDFGEFLRLCRDEEALPLADILAYAGMPRRPAAAATAAAADPAAAPADCIAAPGTVTTFFSRADFEWVLAAYPEKLILVEASLTWCRPCKKIQPVLEKLASAYASQAVLLKFFGNSNEDTKELFKDTLKVRVTPAFFFFRGGELVGSCTGANAARLEENLRLHLAPDELPSEILYPQQVAA